MMRTPMSRMDILTDTEIKALLDKSALKTKYNEVIDRESAYEILNAKIANEAPKEEAPKKTETKKYCCSQDFFCSQKEYRTKSYYKDAHQCNLCTWGIWSS